MGEERIDVLYFDFYIFPCYYRFNMLLQDEGKFLLEKKICLLLG